MNKLHETSEDMVKDLLNILQINPDLSYLDVGSGTNKVWFNNINSKIKYECEIEDGNDFFNWDKKVDWIVGNPPYHIGWDILDHSSNIAQIGIAFLTNINFINCLSPKRLDILSKKSFFINKIHIVQDMRWRGRYYFIIFTKIENPNITWNTITYTGKT